MVKNAGKNPHSSRKSSKERRNFRVQKPCPKIFTPQLSTLENPAPSFHTTTLDPGKPYCEVSTSSCLFSPSRTWGISVPFGRSGNFFPTKMFPWGV
jgi:hypothetical protein